MEPFTENHNVSIASIGETRLITRICSWLGTATLPPPLGIGDDCAVLPASRRRRLIKVDPVIYGRHFDATSSPRAAAEKLLKRNLSDIAAMGGRPVAAVIALALDRRVKLAWIEAFYRGLAACARRYHVPVVGGDVAESTGFLGAFLTLIGEPAGERILTRRGGRPGDWIYVTGKLGGSLLGHHLAFKPRLAEGAWLARQPPVRSMMDISDGLAKDLWALTPSGCEPALDASVLPISADAKRLAKRDRRPALEHALTDGEDYELVFTVAANSDRRSLEKTWRQTFRTPVTCIGRFVKTDRAPVDALTLTRLQGYEHLR